MLLTGKGLSGSTHYCFAFDASENVWQTTTSTYVAFVAANYANYKIMATEPVGSGRFYATAPTGAVRYEMRRQVGSLATDPVVWTGDLYTGLNFDFIAQASAPVTLENVLIEVVERVNNVFDFGGPAGSLMQNLSATSDAFMTMIEEVTPGVFRYTTPSLALAPASPAGGDATEATVQKVLRAVQANDN